MELRFIATHDDLCRWCNNNKEFSPNTNYQELLKWTRYVGHIFMETDFQNRDNTFDPICYFAGIYDHISSHQLALFYKNGELNEESVCYSWIYYGFPSMFYRNPKNLSRVLAKELILPNDEKIKYVLHSGLIYIEAQEEKPVKVIEREENLTDKIYLQRKKLTLDYMYKEQKYPRNGKFLLDTGDGPLNPVFNPYNFDIIVYGRPYYLEYELIPDPYFIEYKGYINDIDIVKWEDKKPIAFWRGASTGGILREDTWQDIPRVKLALISESCGAQLDAKISDVVQCESKELQTFLKQKTIYSGSRIPFSKFYEYKYLINIDGNCCAWNSMFKKLKSNSVVLHVESDQRQWYYDKLKSWVHYIPIKNDLSDLIAIIHWCTWNDEKCKEIAQNSINLMRSIEY